LRTVPQGLKALYFGLASARLKTCPFNDFKATSTLALL